MDRVDRRDAERVGDDRARRAAAAGRLDPLLAGEADEVGDDEEVAGVAHRGDDAELVVEPRLELRRDRPVAAREAALALLAQPALDGLAVRHREVRDPELAERQLEVDHLGDPARVADRLALVGEERRHLGRRLQVELVRLEPQPVRACRGCCRCRRRAGRRGPPTGPRGRSGGRWSRRAAGPTSRREPEELLVEPALLGQAVVLELEEEAVLARRCRRTRRRACGRSSQSSTSSAFGISPPRQADSPIEPLAVAGEVLAVDARLVVVAVEVGVGDEPAEVPVADEVLGQEDEVERLGVGLALLVAHRAAGRRTSPRR